MSLSKRPAPDTRRHCHAADDDATPIQLFVNVRGTGLPEHGKTLIVRATPTQSIAATHHQLLTRLRIIGSKQLRLMTASGAPLADEATTADLGSPFLTLCVKGACSVWDGYGALPCRAKRCPYYGTSLNNGFCSTCGPESNVGTTRRARAAALLSGGLGDCLSHVVQHLGPRGWLSLLLINHAWREDMHTSGPHHVHMRWPHTQLSALQYRLLMRTGLFQPHEASVASGSPSLFLPGASHGARLDALTLLSCQPAANLLPLAACVRLHTLRLVRCTALGSLAGLSGCLCLRELTLRGCRQLTDLSEVARCRRLATLTIEDADQTTDLASLSAKQDDAVGPGDGDDGGGDGDGGAGAGGAGAGDGDGDGDDDDDEEGDADGDGDGAGVGIGVGIGAAVGGGGAGGGSSSSSGSSGGGSGGGGGGALATLTLSWCRGLDVSTLTRCASLRVLRVHHCCCLTGMQALAYAPALTTLEWGGACDATVKDGLLLLLRMVQDHVSSSQLKLVPGGEVLEEEDWSDDDEDDEAAPLPPPLPQPQPQPQLQPQPQPQPQPQLQPQQPQNA